MMTAVIIEDSRLARMELKLLLKPSSDVTVAGEAATAAAGLEIIRLLKPDLIFLDIHLPGKNGFELLQELDDVPLVIFTTAFDQYALRSFDFNTIDYLLKPVVPERLAQALGKVRNYLASSDRLQTDHRIFIKDGNRCWLVNKSDIRYCASKGNYTQLHFNGGSPLLLKPLQQVALMLDQRHFVQINRQQIVNINAIHKVTAIRSGIQLQLNTGEIFEVSRRQAFKIKALYPL